MLGPGEYVTAVSGYYDKVFGVDSPAIISLKFITNKRTSIPYGLESGTKFVLEKNDHKVVGFYGQAGDFNFFTKSESKWRPYPTEIHNGSDMPRV